MRGARWTKALVSRLAKDACKEAGSGMRVHSVKRVADVWYTFLARQRRNGGHEFRCFAFSDCISCDASGRNLALREVLAAAKEPEWFADYAPGDAPPEWIGRGRPSKRDKPIVVMVNRETNELRLAVGGNKYAVSAGRQPKPVGPNDVQVGMPMKVLQHFQLLEDDHDGHRRRAYYFTATVADGPWDHPPARRKATRRKHA
jgi:hypothetical protein